ncbi:mltA-interacting MipA family protein, partial [Yersinia pestis PY-94]
MKKDRK